MSLQFILLFVTTVFIASIIPGPSMLLALTHGIQYGARKAVASAMGNVVVTLIQAAVSIAGLGAVLLTSETVFTAIKWAGAAYLIYIGISLFRAPEMNFNTSEDNKQRQEKSAWKMFLQAAIVTAGNPKAIVFFTAIFPQFIQTGQNYFIQFGILLSLLSLIAFVCFMLYAICGQRLLFLFNKNKVRKYFNKVTGGTFIGAGIALASSNS